MSQDYTKRHSSRAKQQPVKRSSPLPAFFIGTVFGVVLANMLPGLLEKAPDASAKVEDVSASVKASASDLKFDFYTLLKNTEIIVPNDQSSDAAQREPEENFSYLLQAGSFKLAGDAEALRVKLLLLNLTAKVETVGLGSGEKWHRVLVGPFTDASSMAYARTKLSENEIDSLLLKRKL